MRPLSCRRQPKWLAWTSVHELNICCQIGNKGILLLIKNKRTYYLNTKPEVKIYQPKLQQSESFVAHD